MRIVFLLTLSSLVGASISVSAAEIADLRSLLGFRVGSYTYSEPPSDLVSLTNGRACSCPDICQLEGSDRMGIEVSVVWGGQEGACGADLMTITGGSATSDNGAAPAELSTLFALTQEDIIARYGRPTTMSPVAGGQIAYCTLLEDSDGGAAPPGDILYTAFRFGEGYLIAIRIGVTGYCPDVVFTG